MKKIYKRTCPGCNNELNYKTKQSFNKQSDANKLCRSCAKSGERNRLYGKFSGSNNPMFGKKGSLNPFYGKTHNEETLKKISRKGSKLSPEHRKKFIEAGNKNRLKGSIYTFWVEKYGEEEANKRLALYKEKQSKLNSGKNNSMYGKPSPQGSGNGWSGWYKGWFFRSLRELKCVLDFEKQNLQWKSAESNQYMVEYICPLGTRRNYFPDFIVGNVVYECKPKRLWKTPLVCAKMFEAEKYFQGLGIEFKLIDPGKMCEKEFYNLWKTCKIKLTERYEKKALKLYERK